MSVPFFVSGFGPAVKLPLTPALPKRRTAQRERGPIFKLFEPEFDSQLQVGATRTNPSVSSLSLRERVRVRGFSLFGVYLRLSITGNCATSLALFNGARINPRCVPSGPITARLPL